MYHPQPDPILNPYSSHYPNQYPSVTSAIPSSLPYFPSFQHPQHLKPAPITEISPPDPPEPSITPAVASKSVQRLISLELQRAGFESAVQPAVQRLEVELVTCMFVALLHLINLLDLIFLNISYTTTVSKGTRICQPCQPRRCNRL